MFELINEAQIQAPPDFVYDLIADVDGYSEWNPWNFRASGGPAAVGRTLTMSVKLGRWILKVKHDVSESRRGERLTTRDLGWFTRLASGVRTRDLQAAPEGSRYRVVLAIAGPLAWVVRWQLGKHLEAGLRSETDAVKRTAEARWRARAASDGSAAAESAEANRD